MQYLKLDGCNNDHDGYTTGYPAMGAALQKSGRNITYSCSWPAYLGSDENSKPWDAMIAAGCNLPSERQKLIRRPGVRAKPLTAARLVGFIENHNTETQRH